MLSSLPGRGMRIFGLSRKPPDFEVFATAASVAIRSASFSPDAVVAARELRGERHDREGPRSEGHGPSLYWNSTRGAGTNSESPL